MFRLADIPPLLLGLVILVLAQLAGLGLVALLHLPVPGVVIGLVLLVILGALRPTAFLTRWAEPAGAPLLKHLQLLFIPPGVGIVVELEALAQNALPIALAVGGSFAVTLILAGQLLQALLRRQDRRGGGADGAGPGGRGTPKSDGPGADDGGGPGSPGGPGGPGVADGPGVDGGPGAADGEATA